MTITMSEPLISKLAEYGMAGVIVIVVVFGFILKVLSILRETSNAIVGEIKDLTKQQRMDNSALVEHLRLHDERSGERHVAMLQRLDDHHALAARLYERLDRQG